MPAADDVPRDEGKVHAGREEKGDRSVATAMLDFLLAMRCTVSFVTTLHMHHRRLPRPSLHVHDILFQPGQSRLFVFSSNGHQGSMRQIAASAS